MIFFKLKMLCAGALVLSLCVPVACFAERTQAGSVEIFDTGLLTSDFFLPGNPPVFSRNEVQRIMFIRTKTAQVLDSVVPVGKFYVSLEFFKNYPEFNAVLTESILDWRLTTITNGLHDNRSFLPDYSKLTPRQSIEKYITRLTPVLAFDAACFEVGQKDCHDGVLDAPERLLTYLWLENKIYEPVGNFVSVGVLTANKGCASCYRFHSYFHGITFNLKTKTRVWFEDIFTDQAKKELPKLLTKHDPRGKDSNRDFVPKPLIEGFILTHDGIYFPYNTFESNDIHDGEYLVRIFLPINEIRHLLTDEAKAAYR